MTAMRRVTVLYYWLAGLGAAGFILSFPLHSRFAFVGGVCLIASASLFGAVCYVTDRDPQTRPQNLAGAAFAVLFAAWWLAWLAFPELHVRWIPLVVGCTVVVGASVIVYLNLQDSRACQRRGPPTLPR